MIQNFFFLLPVMIRCMRVAQYLLVHQSKVNMKKEVRSLEMKLKNLGHLWEGLCAEQLRRSNPTRKFQLMWRCAEKSEFIPFASTLHFVKGVFEKGWDASNFRIPQCCCFCIICSYKTVLFLSGLHASNSLYISKLMHHPWMIFEMLDIDFQVVNSLYIYLCSSFGSKNNRATQDQLH